MSARSRHSPARVVIAVLLGLALCACTDNGAPDPVEPEESAEDPEPPPQVGIDAAVVLPPRSATAAPTITAIDVDLQVLEAANQPELGSVRGLTPDEPVFVRDLARFAGQRGADLTCVLGDDGHDVVMDLHRLHPAARFCAVVVTEPETPSAAGIDVLVLRSAEVGHVVGRAAEALPGDRVAVAVGGGALEQGPFLEGLRAGLGGVGVTMLDDADLDGEELVRRAVAAGTTTIVVGTDDRAPAVIAAARTAGLAIVAPAELASDGDGVAVTWRVRWDRILQPSIDRAVGRTEPAGLSMGFAEGVFDVQVVSGPVSLDTLVPELIADIERGALDPLTAAPPPPPPPPPPDEPDESPDPDETDDPPPTGTPDDDDVDPAEADEDTQS